MAKRLLGCQLFVSRLSFYTTNKDLKRLFSPFGAITEARLVVDPRTQRPKGFGFVTFESDVDAESALRAMNGKVRQTDGAFAPKDISLAPYQSLVQKLCDEIDVELTHVNR